jgi:glycosyltransferase involved in cell wall biosynthesis
MLYDTKTHGHHIEYIKQISDYLINEGDSVTLVTTEHPKGINSLPYEKESFSIEVIEGVGSNEFRNASGAASLYYKLKGLWTLSSVSKKWAADVVHILSYEEHVIPFALTLMMGYTFGNRQLLLSIVVPYFLGERRTIGSYGVKDWLIRYCFRATLFSEHVNYITVLSEKAKKKVENASKGCEEQKIKVIGDPVEKIKSKEEKKESRGKLKVETDKPVVLYFGRITKTKGANTLLEAIKESTDRICWFICGEDMANIGGTLRELKSSGEVNCRDIIIKDKYIENKLVNDYFISADIVVLPYEKGYVGTSGVLQKAAAAEVPVIASRVGLIGSTVKKWGMGKTFEPGNSSKLVQKVSELIDSQEDFIEYKQNMREYAEKHSWGDACNTIRNCYLS